MKKLSQNKNNQSGQSFIELIAALLIVSIVLVSLVALVTRSIANATFARNKTLATSYAQESLEWLRSERDRDWASFYGRTNSSWCIATLSWTSNGSHTGTCAATDVITSTIFRRNISFTRIDASNVDATVTVSWSDGNGTHQSVATTSFTNWKGNE